MGLVGGGGDDGPGAGCGTVVAGAAGVGCAAGGKYNGPLMPQAPQASARTAAR